MVNQYLCWTEWPCLLILFLQIFVSLSMPYENHYMKALGLCSLMEFLVLICISDIPMSNWKKSGRRVIHMNGMPLSWIRSVEILRFYWVCGVGHQVPLFLTAWFDLFRGVVCVLTTRPCVDWLGVLHNFTSLWLLWVILNWFFCGCRGYVGIHSSGFRDFLLKPELLRAIVDCGFEHPSEG